MGKITGIFVNPTEATAHKVTINRSLDGYREALGYDDPIDFTMVRLDDRSFVIANSSLFTLLYPDTLPSVFEMDDQPVLYGNLFICRHDDSIDTDSLNTRAGNGEINEVEYLETLLPHLIDLTEDDIALVLSHVLVTPSDLDPEAQQVSLRHVEYYREYC